MRNRQRAARLASLAFLVFFGAYTAGVIVWLAFGIPPVLAAHFDSVHQALHKWGAGHQAYVVCSARGLEQKATAASRTRPAREIAFQSARDVQVWFENTDGPRPHNFVIYDPVRPHDRPIFQTGTITSGGHYQYRFRTPASGTYAFRDNNRPEWSGKVVVINGSDIPDVVRRFPVLATIVTGAAIDAHIADPVGKVILQYLFSVLNVGLGLLLIRLRPRDLAARLLAFGMIGTAAVFNFSAHSALEEIPGLAVLLHDNYHLAAGLAYVYALLVFPDGKLVAHWSRSRWFKWPLPVAYLVAATAAVYFNRGRLHGDPTGFVLFFGVLIPVAGVTSQSLRLRRAPSAPEREQSRLLVWALSLALGMALVLIGLKVAIAGADLKARTVQDLDQLAFLVFPILFAMIPIALTVVLVRYRLWDIDRVINQTLVYGTVTGVLGFAYVASVVLLPNLLEPVTSKSSLVVAGSTLAVAALFRPARDWVQAFIDRRFYRAKYDAARTMEAFSARVRDELDLDNVTRELLAVAEATMQPARVSLWLRRQDGPTPEEREVVCLTAEARLERSDGVAVDGGGAARVAALSPSIRGVVRRARRTGERGSQPAQAPVAGGPRQMELAPVKIALDDPIAACLQTPGGPVDVDKLQLVSPGRDALRATGVKLAVPLVSQGELIGLLGLGPRLSERDYSSDDRRLLDDLAKRGAPALRVAQLVRQLVHQQAVELRARERIEQELRVAQLIQQQFLPREVPDLPGWRVATYYQPARAVGGDFYDFIELPDGRVGLVCGDVTDKGVPAALVMATTHSILRGDGSRLSSPGRVLERANDLLFAEIPPQMFVTCLYGVLDPATGRLRYANTGHNLPYVQTADGVVELRATGMPLGLMPAMSYEEQEATLEPGDTLLLHSDGLVEAHDPERRMFGFSRLMALVGGCSGGRELIDLLLAELREFTGPGWEQEDDITLVTVQRAALPAVPESPAPAHAGSRDIGARVLTEFSVPSEPGSERQAMAQVAQAVADLDLAAERLERLKTAVAEAVVNAIEHGNRNRPELGVRVAVLASASVLSVRVTDRGGGRPIAEPETPDLSAKLAGRQPPRGWGLFLIKNMVDELAVTSDERHHTVELIFHLEAGGNRHETEAEALVPLADPK
jgi:serine phosphatase RsbU (regulator of sigma subunit)/anti-sigma regulatory factor (Ser/Thr protein kinase)